MDASFFGESNVGMKTFLYKVKKTGKEKRRGKKFSTEKNSPSGKTLVREIG